METPIKGESSLRRPHESQGDTPGKPSTKSRKSLDYESAGKVANIVVVTYVRTFCFAA